MTNPLLDEGQALGVGNAGAQRRHLREAADSYGGRLLPGFYEEWVTRDAGSGGKATLTSAQGMGSFSFYLGSPEFYAWLQAEETPRSADTVIKFSTSRDQGLGDALPAGTAKRNDVAPSGGLIGVAIIALGALVTLALFLLALLRRSGTEEAVAPRVGG